MWKESRQVSFVLSQYVYITVRKESRQVSFVVSQYVYKSAERVQPSFICTFSRCLQVTELYPVKYTHSYGTCPILTCTSIL